MTRSWVVRECFLEEMVFKGAKQGGKAGRDSLYRKRNQQVQSPQGKGSYTIPALKMAETRVYLIRSK